MIFETQHLLILVLFPIVGLVVSSTVSIKLRQSLGVFLFVVFLPIFSGYDYVIGWLYEFLLTLLIGLLYSLVVDVFYVLWKKIVSTVVLSILVFLVFGFVAFVDAFAGSKYVEKEWGKKEYTVQFIRSQGFAGGPAFYYQVVHQPIGGMFEKVLVEHGRRDPNKSCVISFEKEGIEIDICK